MLDKTKTDWHAASGKLAIEGRAFINGRYVDALSGATRTAFNPANGKALVDVAHCGYVERRCAVGRAHHPLERRGD